MKSTKTLAELAEWLAAKGARLDVPSHGPMPEISWNRVDEIQAPPLAPDAIAALATIRPDQIPAGLMLRSAGFVERVAAPARWLAALRMDVARGPGYCRARNGALQEDIGLAIAAAAGGCR